MDTSWDDHLNGWEEWLREEIQKGEEAAVERKSREAHQQWRRRSRLSEQSYQPNLRKRGISDRHGAAEAGRQTVEEEHIAGDGGGSSANKD